MSPTAGLSFSEGGKAVATITNIFDIQPVDCRVVGEAGWWRPRHNLSDWNRRHIPGSFCFCFGFDNESLFSDYPRQFCPTSHHPHPHRRFFPFLTLWTPDQICFQAHSGHQYIIAWCLGRLWKSTKKFLIDEASIFPWPQNLEVMMDFEM